MNKNLSEQSDWDELLDFITDRQLTPILGKEMYKFKQDDLLIPVDEYLSQQMLGQYHISDQQELTLTQAVNYLVNEKKVKTMDIIRKLKLMLREINFEFPLLTQFLSITDLNYYVNTAVYNNVLENNLSAIRKQAATSINFSINEPFSDADDLDKLKAPFVFNVFGSLLNTVDPALSEEDMLEYTGHFKERIKNSANIINALKNKNLLFLGCAFPDWMVRFILRLLSNEPMHDWGSKRTIIVVNDMSDVKKKQYEFLKNYDVVTYEGNTKDFVEELTTRWKQKNPASVKNKMVFLSYTVKDKEAVENLKKAIEGISNVTCWYDNREIVPGDDFKTEIAKNIKSADLFIPLISANSLLHKDGYVQLEWFTADNVNTFRKIDGNTSKYLMPVVIDDTNPYDNNVPKYFSELSIGKVPAGNPGQEFINQIRETLNLS
ncbi:toll/interleukin-1 receptor domain-containing protein [Ginsengibacter hankyongi]|uniref:Toll/interleukin-1 receptor domain-containing protein n=1 Tax=Ginsengibacter hankyongi TaxID=2607284 RepID=A0A5J5IKJ1_9BACT|nr:toll/interleukin-1 receptor domain-containing protein [Ginsengibacter hankyongi]KAA9041261.1 toll/interleukin-1 receptor domain-containing protein [Ginsengibacter hankyongi]